MSPLFIEILLWHYGRPSQYPEWNKGASQGEIRDRMLVLGLLEPDLQSDGFRITDKGRCLVEAMCALQMPIQSWKMP